MSRKFIAIKSKGKVHNVKTSTDFKDHPQNLQIKRKKSKQSTYNLTKMSDNSLNQNLMLHHLLLPPETQTSFFTTFTFGFQTKVQFINGCSRLQATIRERNYMKDQKNSLIPLIRLRTYSIQLLTF